MITRDGKSASKADFDTLAELNSNFIDGTTLDTSTATRPPAAHTQAASTISDSTTAGRALLTAADAAAQLVALGTDAAGTARPASTVDGVAAATVRAGAAAGATAVQPSTAPTLTGTNFTGIPPAGVTGTSVVNADARLPPAPALVDALKTVRVNAAGDAYEAGVVLGTAAQAATGDFATAAQGARAPTAPANPGDDGKVWTAGAGAGSWAAPSTSVIAVESATLVDANTLIYMIGDGAHNSTTFTDSQGHTFAAVGTAKHTRTRRLANASALWLDGDSDCIRAADHADWDLGTGAFTAEAWVLNRSVVGLNVARRIISRGSIESNNGDWCFGFGYNIWGAGLYKMNFALRAGGAVVDYSSNPLDLDDMAPDRWNHAAFVRAADGTYYFFWNRVLVGTGATASEDLTSASPLYIGARTNDAGFTTYTEFHYGLLDEVRLSNVARYTADGSPVARNGNNHYLVDGSSRWLITGLKKY